MTPIEWIALTGIGVTSVGVVGTVVYSHATLKHEVKSLHKCQRYTLLLVARYGRALRKHLRESRK